MNAWAVISGVVGIIAVMFAIFLHLNSSIDKRIESKFADPKFIRKVADEVRLPFVIFNEDQSIIVDTGAMNYIDKIEVKKDDRQEVSEIIISPKRYMAIAPILESLSVPIEFESPINGEKFDFVYKKIEIGGITLGKIYPSGKPKRNFRLQLIMLPKE